MKSKTKNALIIILMFIVIFSIVYMTIRPSNDKNWSKDQKILSYSDVNNDTAKIYNIRNITYRNTTDYDVSYYNQTYDISQIDSLWFVLEPFDMLIGSAHTFLSFGFNNSSYISISVEIRREINETYDPLSGVLKKYELMYVIGDENDLIKLRAIYRNDSVYLYPVNTTKETMQKIFLDMLNRANKLKDNPEFYNTITNTCTTNIVNHVNKIKPGRIPFSIKILAPSFSGKFVYDLGIIDTSLPYERAVKHFQINALALKYQNDSDFSNKIRLFNENNA